MASAAMSPTESHFQHRLHGLITEIWEVWGIGLLDDIAEENVSPQNNCQAGSYSEL